MKEIAFTIYLCGYLLFVSCTNTKRQVNDVSCLRVINSEISKELEKELGQKYKSIKDQIRLVIKFYIDGRGSADSIVFVKSNLQNFDINEDILIQALERMNYKCLRDVFYNEKLKPDNIIVTFNPELCY
jgi:hypothetical protein